MVGLYEGVRWIIQVGLDKVYQYNRCDWLQVDCSGVDAKTLSLSQCNNLDIMNSWGKLNIGRRTFV